MKFDYYIAVNVSPVPDAMFGNLKLRWGKNPFFYSNSTIRNINYETGQIMLMKFDYYCNQHKHLLPWGLTHEFYFLFHQRLYNIRRRL